MSLRLPSGIVACLLDLDGVVTRTATLHAAAWKTAFDEVLQRRSAASGAPFVPFDPVADYDRYVDGMPRLDGTRTFLRSRGIELPEGRDDEPGTDTVHGIANHKNELVLTLMRAHGVDVYPGSRRFLDEARHAGMRTAVVSSSANAALVLRSAGLEDAFDVRVDGDIAHKEHLAGKPSPDTYLAAAHRLAVEPAHAAVFEDALAGIEAAVAGKFGFVVGVDRVGQAEALAGRGADAVVGDLADLIEP